MISCIGSFCRVVPWVESWLKQNWVRMGWISDHLPDWYCWCLSQKEGSKLRSESCIKSFHLCSRAWVESTRLPIRASLNSRGVRVITSFQKLFPAIFYVFNCQESLLFSYSPSFSGPSYSWIYLAMFHICSGGNAMDHATATWVQISRRLLVGWRRFPFSSRAETYCAAFKVVEIFSPVNIMLSRVFV